MTFDFYESVKRISKSRIGKFVFRRGFMSAAAVVVFITTYMLILPAITQSTKVYCDKEEHQHSESCYEAEKVLICNKSETEGHTHSDDCYTTNTYLMCTLEEFAGHQHSDSCYDEELNLICGEEESEGHYHSDSCYGEEITLTCGQQEAEAHKHTDACYEDGKEVLTCDLKEHTHDKACYSNPKADVETAADWEKTFRNVKLTGNWAEDLVKIADTQIGYEESTDNYIVAEDDEIKGYTRYGAWYGDEYGDWCAMFVSFCIHYADIPKADMPIAASCQKWIETLNQKEYRMYYAVNDKNDYEVLTEGEEYTPAMGDLVFFNWDKKDDADHVGIITSYKEATETSPAEIKTIEGNAPSSVSEHTYKLDDESIMGFAKLPENPDPEAGKEEDESEDSRVSAVAEYDAYTVTVYYEEGTEIPEGAVLEAEVVEDEELSESIAKFLEAECTYTEEQILNIRFAVDGNTYKVEAPAEVEIAIKNQEEAEDTEAANLILQMAGNDYSVLETEITEEDGTTIYRYSQEELTKVAMISGASMGHKLSYQGKDYEIIVTYTDEANLPEDVELTVSEVTGDALEERCNELSEMDEVNDVQYVRIFDISFQKDEEEYEPEAPVQVQIVRNDLKDLIEDMEPGIVHFGEEEAELIESELIVDEDGVATFEFEGEAFSEYASYVSSDPFGELETSGHPATIATVDTKEIGLTINMFDYWGSTENVTGIGSNDADSIDKNWVNGSSHYVFDGVNSYYGNITNNSRNWGAVRQALQNNLYFSASGAVFNNENNNNNNNGDDVLERSINGFTGSNDGYGGKARQGIVNSTLTNDYPTLSTTGRSLDYLFNTNNASYKRTYADLNHLFKDDGNGYITYDSDDNYAYLDKASSNFKVYGGTYHNSDGSMIGFFPFNEYNSNYTQVKGPQNGNNDNHRSYNHYNHHFGLTLSGNFTIPENCEVNGNPMTFHFSGDDDMWLFVDGVLVMDIGGIHEPCDGDINFKTGEITISGAVPSKPGADSTMGTSANIADLFAAAGKTWDGSVDSEHTIKVFYLERGGCYSNLAMTMNILLYKKTNVSVTKKVASGTEETSEIPETPAGPDYSEEASNLEFTFQLMVEERTGSNTYKPYVGKLLVTEANGTTTREIETDKKGYFTIKAGEVATTKDKFLSTKRYYVNEIGVDGETFELVKFNNKESTTSPVGDGPVFDAYNDGNLIYTGTLGKITNVPKIDYTQVTVKKDWYDGNNNHDGDQVTFKLIRTDENGNTKELEDSAYVLNKDNNWTKTITNLEKTTLGHSYTYTVVETSATPGYTAEYKEPKYDADGNATLTIKNEPKVNIEVEKKWYKGDGTEWDSTISNSGVQVQLYRTYYKGPQDNSHTVTFLCGRKDPYNSFEAVVTTQVVGDGGSISFRGGRWYSDNIPSVTITSGTANNATSNNNVFTITNIRSDITVYLNFNMYSNDVDGLRSNFQITKYSPATVSPEYTGTEKVGDPVPLNKSNDWSYAWGELETPNEKDGYTYKYYVQEISDTNAFSASYADKDGTSSVTKINFEGAEITVGEIRVDETTGKGYLLVKNTLTEFELPHTGGIGTTRYTWGGFGLIFTALVLYNFSLRRRRERRLQ